METPRGQIDKDIDDPGSSIESSEVSSLLAPDIEAFYANIPALIPSFSSALTSAVDDLRAITDTDPSTAESKDLPRTPRVRTRQATTRSTQPALLNPRIDERLRQLRQVQLSELPTARKQMAATAAEVLATRAQVLERTVVLLERAKHGALSRATKAKAEHLATVAQGIEGKLGLVYTILQDCLGKANSEQRDETGYWVHHIHPRDDLLSCPIQATPSGHARAVRRETRACYGGIEWGFWIWSAR